MISIYYSIPKWPFSRPNSECLTPPNGVSGLEMTISFAPTMPYSNAELTFSTLAKSFV
ncbi:hemagglutinin [Listeria seeligeri FSL S4-171]|nr:hemagglutinin [Listeria seeligeri FSL S4-171]